MASTVAFTIALGAEAVAAAALARRTFQACHPGVPFFIVTGEYYRFFARQPFAGHAGEIMGLRAMAGWFLGLSFDRVVYVDSDVLVLEPVPRLVDGPEPVVLTNDVAICDYGIPAPKVNAGVLASASADFWQHWMVSIYSHLLPISGNFFDQLVLRLLCEKRAFPHILLPEKEERDFYNIACHDEPGEWTFAGGIVRKGDARVRLWHWAGYAKKPTLDALPPPVAEAVRPRLDAPPSVDPVWEENLFLAVLERNGPSFLDLMTREISTLSSRIIDGLKVKGPEFPGLYGSEVPAAWDILRPLPEGFHRRLLPQAGRYVYAREKKRLLAPDVAFVDRPGIG
jgi:hypothetical protein